MRARGLQQRAGSSVRAVPAVECVQGEAGPTRHVCFVQGAEHGPSALQAFESLLLYFWAQDFSQLDPAPLDKVTTHAIVYAGCPLDYARLHSQGVVIYVFDSANSLRHIINELRPDRIVLSSYDTRFEGLRRDRRTLRWMHEITRAYDPQASRCSTPLFATNHNVASRLNGWKAEAPGFAHFEHLVAVPLVYHNGPLRILSAGDMSDPRSNFKAFQNLAEKYPNVVFQWLGATRAKVWQNIELLVWNNEEDLTKALQQSDVFIQCPEHDPFPLIIFHALFLGVHVKLPQKHFMSSLPSLHSELDGIPLFESLNLAPQHCCVHLFTKNPKRANDVARARDFARTWGSRLPLVFIRHILRREEPRSEERTWRSFAERAPCNQTESECQSKNQE